MDLGKLFSEQKKLDDLIVKNHGLEDMDKLDYLKMAFRVELGECANEWRGFKFWSNDQKPRTSDFVVNKLSEGKEPYYTEINPLLIEYVDCLHFLLSIGWEIGVDAGTIFILQAQTEKTFVLPEEVNSVPHIIERFDKIHSLFNKSMSRYNSLFLEFISLGLSFGFTKKEIEEAYIAKNKVNHKRQEDGY